MNYVTAALILMNIYAMKCTEPNMHGGSNAMQQTENNAYTCDSELEDALMITVQSNGREETFSYLDIASSTELCQMIESAVKDQNDNNDIKELAYLYSEAISNYETFSGETREQYNENIRNHLNDIYNERLTECIMNSMNAQDTSDSIEIMREINEKLYFDVNNIKNANDLKKKILAKKARLLISVDDKRFDIQAWKTIFDLRNNYKNHAHFDMDDSLIIRILEQLQHFPLDRNIKSDIFVQDAGEKYKRFRVSADSLFSVNFASLLNRTRRLEHYKMAYQDKSGALASQHEMPISFYFVEYFNALIESQKSILHLLDRFDKHPIGCLPVLLKILDSEDYSLEFIADKPFYSIEERTIPLS
ncbi:hypothetical protein ENBRE01_2392 [Enteropsectra breve]|nr:hypothetical protein ENBRE01_2392 [Enteropsectra breve]